MLMMRTVWFDTSGMGRVMVVLFVLLAFKAQRKWQLMLMMRTVWFDTFGAGRLMLVLLVASLGGRAPPFGLCLARLSSKHKTNAHDAQGPV